MIPWVTLDTVTVPGGGTLKLMQRGGEFSILAGPVTLMNSRMAGSEIALAELASSRLKARKNASLLIGGYGMGFTLRAALAGLGPDAKVTVAELVPEILKWASGPMAALTGDSLKDKRVTIQETDVVKLIASSQGKFDAILLDVDNGPDGLTKTGNDKLYATAGLYAARRALKPGGLLAVWSAAPDKNFAGRFANAGFAVEEVIARAHQGRGMRHVIWAGTKTGVPGA